MTQVSQRSRGRILPPSPIDPEVVQREQEKQRALRKLLNRTLENI